MARGGEGATAEFDLDFAVERFGLSEDTFIDPYRFEVMERVEVAGLTYRTDWETVERITVGEQLPMTRDPANEKDPNAVKVSFRGDDIGWVKKEIAAELAPLLDQGATATLKVVEVEEPYHEAHRGEGNFYYRSGRVFGRIAVKIPS